MSSRTLVWLMSTAAILVGMWLLVGVLPDGGSGGEGPEWGTELSGLTPEAVSSLRIEQSGESRALERSGVVWTIDGFPTDSAVVARFWGIVAGSTVGDAVATNPDNHARMGVTADSALTVTFEGRDGPAGPGTILVGNDAGGVGTAYVRRPDENAVHVLGGGLRTQLARSVSDWRDKRVLTIDTALVARVEVERPDGAYSLLRGDSAWSIGPAGGTSADAVSARATQAPAIIAVLEELGGMRATDFPVEGDSLYAAPEQIVVRALGSGGDTLGVLTLGEGEMDRAGRVRGSDTVYRIPGFRIDRVAPPRDRVEAPS